MQNLQDPIEAHPSCDILKSKAENRIDENLKPIESMNFKISFMPRKAIGICNPKEYSKKSNLSSWRENLRKRLSLNVSILVSNVDVPFYPQGIQYVGQMGT
ncbi:unnamed protein product [Rhizophagus irregularis]|nr:unnamed protein product [Rhizophagus irregularis]